MKHRPFDISKQDNQVGNLKTRLMQAKDSKEFIDGKSFMLVLIDSVGRIFA